jgi:hypothetical protein
LLLALLLAAFAPRAEAAPQQMKITFAGYTNQTEALTNFPVLVTLARDIAGSGFTFTDFVTTNGTDLRFYTNATDTGSGLNYEIESWNTNSIAAPTNISNCVLWLKSDAGTLTNSSGAVTNWLDQTGNGNNAINTSTPPTLNNGVINGRPAIRFNGSSQYLLSTFTACTGAHTVVYVAVRRGDGNGNSGYCPAVAYYAGSTDRGAVHYVKNTGLAGASYPCYGNGNTGSYDGLGSYANGTPYIIALPWQTGVGGWSVYKNGSVEGSSSSSVNQSDITGLTLGYQVTPAPSRFWNGDVAEVIVYNRVLTTTELAQVNGYLAVKYGIVVAAPQASCVWVQVPTIPTNGSGAIWARWGDTSASGQLACTTNGTTWDTNFKGVWHLATQGTTLSVTDSKAVSSGVNHGATATSGSADGAAAFVGSSSQWTDTGYTPAGITDFTLSAWIKKDTTGVVFPVSSRNSGTSAGICFLYEDGQGPEIAFNGSGGLSRKRWGSNLSAGFHHVVGTHVGGSSALTLVVDGVSGGTASETAATNPGDAATPLILGRDGNATTPWYFTGSLDEVRFSTVVRSANWVWAEYVNIASNTVFNNYGAMAAGSGITVGSTSNAFPNTFVNATSTWSYTISGVALTNNLTVSVPSSSVFTISSNNVDFGSEVVLATNDVGNVPLTNIWVRFIPTNAAFYSDVITNASPGVPTKLVQVTGLGLAANTPVLAVTPASLDFGNVITNKTSANQMFTVTGVNLTNSVTVTAPSAYFALSTNGSDFSQSPVTLATNGSGGIDITNIYVRFTPTAGQTYAGSISNSTAGAVEVKTVAVTGNGVVQTLVVSTNALASFGTVRTNTTSANLSYNVSGSYLESDVTVTAPSAEFEVSTNSATGFGPACTVTVAGASTPSGGNLSATPVYVRFTPPAVQAYSGSITNSSTGVALQTVGVSGNGYAGKVWTGAASTDWNTADNWSGGVPGPTDDVLIDGAPNGRHPTLDLSGSAVTIKSLTLGSSSTSTLTVANGNVTDKKLTVSSNVTIGAYGMLTHSANTTLETHRLFLEVGGDLTIASGGKIDVTAKGFGTALWPPNPPNSLSSHGGLGIESSQASLCTATYGSLHAPTNCGMRGIRGAGGGAVKLTVTGRTLLTGDITAYGDNVADIADVSARGTQTGAGGSIFLTTGTLEGSGRIRADGGSGSYWLGGGGRVAIVLTAPGTFATHTGLITAYGGAASVAGSGAAGTVYLRGYGVAENDGILIVDNANIVPWTDGGGAKRSTLLGSNTANKTVGEVRLLNNGLLQLAASQTLQVSGVWSNSANAGYGVTNDAGSTVEFVNGGVAGRVYGNTTWQNLTIASAGKVVSFQAGKTNTVAGTPAFSNVTLRSTVDNTQWHLRKAGIGTQPVGRVSVQDSHAGTNTEHLTFLASGGTDLGNNINWGKWPPTGTMILLR